MERFYIKRISDFITIVHRGTHQVIWMGTMQEGREVVKRYIKMGREDFYKELNSLGLKFKTDRSYKDNISEVKVAEEWYNGAWKKTTEQVLETYKLESIPEEEMPLEFIKGLQENKKEGWGIEGNNVPKKEEDKQVKLKTLKKAPKKAPDEVKEVLEYTSRPQVKKAFREGKLTGRQYMELMKKLAQ